MVSDLHKFKAEDLTLKNRAYQSQSDVERRTTLEMRRCCLALGYDAGIESLGWNARSNWQEERGRNQYGNCIDGPHMFVSDGGNTMQNARVFKFPALAIWCFDLCFYGGVYRVLPKNPEHFKFFQGNFYSTSFLNSTRTIHT